MAYVILQVPGDGEVIGLGFLTRIRDNQEFFNNRPGLGNHFQRFTSSGTWTKPAGITWVYAQVIGGGAGGSAINTLARAGGAPGHISSGLFRASDVGSTESVTVGSGGVGAFTPTAGGTSSFGTFAGAGGDASVYTSSSALRTSFLYGRPGQGGANNTSDVTARGIPGIGQGVFTARGADGADSDEGTGGGGGGNAGSRDAGDGGTPGGGGGAASQASRSGDGGRGEVRLWGW